MIHEETDAKQIDIKNLTENLQRRNVTLVEAGRYFQILEKEGMNVKEMAVKVGVPYNFVKACLQSYKEVPEEFKDKIQVRMSSSQTKLEPGKIPLMTAQKIASATKSYGLKKADAKILYKAAAENAEFKAPNIKKYAAAIKSGKKDPINSVANIIHINARFYVTQKEYDRLEDRYITNGPYRAMSGVVAAILSGEINETVKARI